MTEEQSLPQQKKAPPQGVALSSVYLEVDDQETSVVVRAKDSEAIRNNFISVEFLFICLRHLLREGPVLPGMKKPAWTIRYGAEIRNQDLPFLLDHVNLVAVIDPMAPYRSPLKSLINGETLYLVKIAALPFYSKKREMVDRFNGVKRKAHGASADHRTKDQNLPGTQEKPGGQSSQSVRPRVPYSPPEVDSGED